MQHIEGVSEPGAGKEERCKSEENAERKILICKI
jgi:hypothetical protein